jgi:phosphoribosylaminoimidazolecarboxamide formyltransferase / IMP cyclohydrolase
LKKIKSALISVYHKDGLDNIVKLLHENQVEIYSTGGTQTFIESLGIPVIPVEEITSYPSILGGRVKTLHPKIFGGILGRRDLDNDIAQMQEYEIPELDLVIVDLYPFEQTVASGAAHKDIIEKIDIGGISLIRAAAKNYKDVVIVASQNEYSFLENLLSSQNGSTSIENREYLAARAFSVSSHYDTAIYQYFDKENTDLKLSVTESKVLRYGENPHQSAKYFGDINSVFDQLHGKELSYNNLLDVDAAVQLIADYQEQTFAILKHNNACGVASRPKLIDAWKDALAADPVSAFGGVLICNAKIDETTAAAINEIFCEVVIAKDYDADALNILKSKKNRIILKLKSVDFAKQNVRTILNGYLVQDRDSIVETKENLTTVTNKQFTDNEIEDLLFANKLVKHTRSNAIILVKNKQLLGSGTGQTSRVDALRQAIHKAKSFGFELKGSVMASDAFFPFPDCVEIAHLEGIDAVIQPGGSIKDSESVAYCNNNEMAMAVTGNRHFKH